MHRPCANIILDTLLSPTSNLQSTNFAKIYTMKLLFSETRYKYIITDMYIHAGMYVHCYAPIKDNRHTPPALPNLAKLKLFKYKRRGEYWLAKVTKL